MSYRVVVIRHKYKLLSLSGFNTVMNSSVETCPIRCSRFGSSTLSTREKDVLFLIADGKTGKEIAELLHISVGTVSDHRKHVCEKIGLHSTCQLVACSVRIKIGHCRQH